MHGIACEQGRFACKPFISAVGLTRGLGGFRGKAVQPQVLLISGERMNLKIQHASILLAITVTGIYLLFLATMVSASQSQVVTEIFDVSKSDIVGLSREEITDDTVLFIPCFQHDVISDIVVDLPPGVVEGTVQIKSREHTVTWFETVDSSDPLGAVRQTTVSPAQGDVFIIQSQVFSADVLIGPSAGTRNIIEILDDSGSYVKQVRLFTFLNAYTFQSGFSVIGGSIELPVVLFAGDEPPDCVPPVTNRSVVGASYIREVESKFQLQFDRVRETTPFQPQPIPSTMVWSLLLLVLMLWAASYLYLRRSNMS